MNSHIGTISDKIADFLHQTAQIINEAPERISAQDWQKQQDDLIQYIQKDPFGCFLNQTLALSHQECFMLWLATFYEHHHMGRSLRKQQRDPKPLSYFDLYSLSYSPHPKTAEAFYALFKNTQVFQWNCFDWTPKTHLFESAQVAPDIRDAILGKPWSEKILGAQSLTPPIHGFIPLVDWTSLSNSTCIVWQGPKGCGRRTHAQSWSQEQGKKTWLINTQQCTDPQIFFPWLRTILWHHADLVFPNTDLISVAAQYPIFTSCLREKKLTCHILSDNNLNQLPIDDANIGIQSINIPYPNLYNSQKLWKQCLKSYLQTCPESINWSQITHSYRLLPSNIMAVIRKLKPRESVTTDSLLATCRKQTPAYLANLAKRQDTRVTLQNLNLSSFTDEQLRHVLHRYQQRYTLSAQIQQASLGLSVLFWGPPGTGKTIGAKALAGHLGLPLYQVNLATIQSKWIGETEKNLAQLFQEARLHNALLFFDEADALFSKRTQVESVQDKHSNMSTSFLLQALEDYPGLLILATNYKKNLDPAFLRRLHFVICFDLPDVERRAQLWEHWIQKLAMSYTLDSQALARAFELSPARIENICISAQAFASHRQGIESAIIEHQDIERALTQEYSKFESQFIAQQKISEWRKEQTT